MTAGDSHRPLLVAMLLVCICCPRTTFAEGQLSIKPFFEVRQQFEDNVFQVPSESDPESDFVTNIWTGVDFKASFDKGTHLFARYEAAPRQFADFEEKNRHDHLLSVLFRRRLLRNVTFLGVGNLGLRFQPNDTIQEYIKHDYTGQVHVQWSAPWSSQFGVEWRNKYFPNNKNNAYISLMAEARARRRLGALSHIQAGYQIRAYDGAIDPRVLLSGLNPDMDGVRQTVGLSFESMVFGRVLMDWRYQFEVDIATRELQRHERLPSEPEQTSEFDDDDEVEVDFNFYTHRVGSMFVWRMLQRSTVSLSARHHFKFYRDWIVPTTNKKRRDNLTLFRIGFKQDLLEHLSTRLEYTLEKKNSNDPSQEFTGNTYSIRLQYTF